MGCYTNTSCRPWALWRISCCHVRHLKAYSPLLYNKLAQRCCFSALLSQVLSFLLHLHFSLILRPVKTNLCMNFSNNVFPQHCQSSNLLILVESALFQLHKSSISCLPFVTVLIFTVMQIWSSWPMMLWWSMSNMISSEVLERSYKAWFSQAPLL